MKVVIEMYVREIEDETGFRGTPVVGGDLLTLVGSKEQIAEGINKFAKHLDSFQSIQVPSEDPPSLIIPEN